MIRISRTEETTERIDEFINRVFEDHALKCGEDMNFDGCCFVAENDGEIAGAVSGYAYYNEVHICDLVVDEKYRGLGIGSKLLAAFEGAYAEKGYHKVTLTTFGFQAPEFYEKLGYDLEFVRKDKDPKLSKYFYIKEI